MKYISALLILLFIMIKPLAQTAQMARDAQTIQNHLSAILQAWNDFDSKRFSLKLSEDADFTNPSGSTAYGRKAIEQLQEKYFSACDKSSHFKMVNKKIRYITNDITSVDALWENENMRAKEISRGVFACIMTRNNNDWVITVMHVIKYASN
jgi:uncharacterized protein (TIGR02246 family)